MAEERFIPHNLPWKEVGRVKHCVIENLPVIGTEDDAPEAYIGGCHVDYVLRAVNSHEALLAAVRHALAIENSVTMGQEKELKGKAKEVYESAIALAGERI